MRTRGLAVGANSYISKPFAYAELVDEIFRLLESSSAERIGRDLF